MTLPFRYVEHLNELPTTSLLAALGPWLGIPTPGYTAGSRTAGLDPSYARADHRCGTLLAAVIGGILAWTLFGAGYMVLTFGRSLDQPSWPSIPTDHFLNALRPGLSPLGCMTIPS